MVLKWMKCDPDTWCSFKRLNTKNLDYNGVYVIFYLGNINTPGRVVYVGQGNIKDRINAHQRNPKILGYAHKDLRVTWAKVHQNLDRIEKGLADRLHPLVGEAYPDVIPLAVNSPF